ncbi:MAG: hypothetical protein M1823_004810, partial [Watsoniomyces obsoletus]
MDTFEQQRPGPRPSLRRGSNMEPEEMDQREENVGDGGNITDVLDLVEEAGEGEGTGDNNDEREGYINIDELEDDDDDDHVMEGNTISAQYCTE